MTPPNPRTARPNVDDLYARQEAAAAAKARLLEQMLRARNPLLLQAQAEQPAQTKAALTRGPAPTVFAAGDLPAFTASGVAPERLLDLPWFIRHAAAAADLSGAQALWERFGRWSEAAAADYTMAITTEPEFRDCDEANRDYQWRFTSWLNAVYVTVAESAKPKPARSLDQVLVEAVAAHMLHGGFDPDTAVRVALRRSDEAGGLRNGSLGLAYLDGYIAQYGKYTPPHLHEAARRALAAAKPAMLEESNPTSSTLLRLGEALKADNARPSDNGDEIYDAIYGPQG